MGRITNVGIFGATLTSTPPEWKKKYYLTFQAVPDYFSNLCMWARRLSTRLLIARSYSRSTDARLHMAAVVTQTPSRPPAVPKSNFSEIMGTQLLNSEYVHAWGLLEACLEANNLERAEFVLLGFSEICHDRTDITLAVNNYLSKLANLNPEDPTVAKGWLNRIQYILKGKFEPNTLTDAIMLRNAYTSGNASAYMHLVRRQLPKILSHVEVFGIRAVQDLIHMSQLDKTKIDPKVQDLLETHKQQQQKINERIGLSTSQVEPEADQGDDVKLQPIFKGSFDALEPTQSAGLRSIYHVLAGLRLNSREKQEVKSLPLTKEKFVDFFEMYKQLETDEERAQFEEFLDGINERRQQALETRGVEAARMKWRDMFQRMVAREKSGEKVQPKGLEVLLWEWSQQMMPLIEEEFQKIDELLKYNKAALVPPEVRKKHGKSFQDRFEYGPFLRLAKKENLPAITMMELLRLNSTKGVSEGIKSVKAVLAVGKNVEVEYRLQSMKEKESALLKGHAPKNRRTLSNLRYKIRQASLEGSSNSWPNYVRAKIGSLLLSLFLRVAKVNVYGTDPTTGRQVKGRGPAFYHTYQYQGGNKVGVIRPHKVVANYLTGETAASSIQPQNLPMLVEPRPWTSWNQGGYYYSNAKIIRTHDSPEQLAYVREAAKRGDLDDIYRGLNVLGRTPWTINKDMFRLISKIWNSKRGLLDIPPAVGPHPEPDSLPTEPPRDADPQVRRDYLRQLRKITLENGALYSQRCDLNYKLDVARAYLGERFYMPHNLDFRGRAYPLCTHLNHLGNDVSRSLLMFWNGRKLGPNGLRWLKIHASNLFGNSKLSFDDRVKFIDDNMDKAIDSVKNPLKGEKWWQTADDPFQALAALMEIRKAIDSGDPENYISHLSVHMDGSCNGLQHYAALGGDIEGAREVNLVAADKPQDVYTRVLHIVKAKVKEDADKGLDSAKVLLPVLSRKVVKQTVMTHVYGVTFIGAREQIANRLKEIDGMPQEKIFVFSAYLAGKVLAAVRELFESAHLIQDWLADNATRISHSIGISMSGVKPNQKPEFLSSVIWTTPLGLPIVQPYRQSKRRQVSTELQTVYISDPYSIQGVNSRKQRTAFPPNYVHSLDATHMLLSAIAAEETKIDFASVHDSYWTHAADVDTLNTNLRECFVDLYNRDHIRRLREEFIQRYQDLAQLVVIPADSDLAEQVRQVGRACAVRKYGVERNLNLGDVIEVEKESQRAKEPFETPLSVVAKYPQDELADLIEEGEILRRTKQAKNAAKIAPRSTEHAGTGFDSLSEDDEDLFKLPSSAKLVHIWVPLRIPEVPPRGEFKVENVLTSPYFFS